MTSESGGPRHSPSASRSVSARLRGRRRSGPGRARQLLEAGDVELASLDLQPVRAALSLEPPVAPARGAEPTPGCGASCARWPAATRPTAPRPTGRSSPARWREATRGSAARAVARLRSTADGSRRPAPPVGQVGGNPPANHRNIASAVSALVSEPRARYGRPSEHVRSGPPHAGGAGGDGDGSVRRRQRPHGPQRRPARHREGLRRRRVQRPVGDQHLRAGLRRADRDRRAAGRHVRPAADLLHRRGDLRPLLASWGPSPPTISG